VRAEKKVKIHFFLYLFSPLTKQHWNPLRYLHSIISISHCFFFSPFSFKSNIFFYCIFKISFNTTFCSIFLQTKMCLNRIFNYFFCSTYKQNKGPPSSILLNKVSSENKIYNFNWIKNWVNGGFFFQQHVQKTNSKLSSLDP
jgi:hypothetical protein